MGKSKKMPIISSICVIIRLLTFPTAKGGLLPLVGFLVRKSYNKQKTNKRRTKLRIRRSAIRKNLFCSGQWL